MSSLRIVTDATAEPVTIEDVKIHLRLQSTDTTEDTYLAGLIKGARKEAENRTRRALLPQTWKLVLDDFSSEIVLPRAPLSTNSADVVITYLDETSGNSTTLPSTYYVVDTDSEPGRVRLAYGSEYPDTYPVKNAVQIQFKTGYPLATAAGGPTTDTCPESIEQWIKMKVAQAYEFREPTITGHYLHELHRNFVDGLLDPYVITELDP
jgi:uncharacterized phiE125 gp8 family phage protein